MTPARFPTPYERAVRATLTRALGAGRVRVVVDADAEGVVLPADVRTVQPDGLRLTPLHLSHAYRGAMTLGPLAVEAVLSFGGVPFDVVLPYAAVVFVAAAPEGGDAPEVVGGRGADGEWATPNPERKET